MRMVSLDSLEKEIDADESPRRAILLAYYQGCSHEEVALRLQAPLGTVKSWIRRGLLRLKQCLEQ